MTDLSILRTIPRSARSVASPDPEALSSLVAAVYDAAVEPSKWGSTLGAASNYVGGWSAALYAKSISGMANGVYHDDGAMIDKYKQLYFERYSALDPSNAGHFFAELDQPVSTEDILDYDEFRASRFYQEWAGPQHLVDFLTAPIEKNGEWAAMFGIFFRERDGMVSEPIRQRMRLLVPHIRRAVMIGKVIEEGSQQAAKFGDVLDGLAAGLFFVDAGGRIVHSNAAGVEMLTEGIAVTSIAGRFATPDRNATAALAEKFAAAQTGDLAAGTKGIAVPILARDHSHFVAHILPLTSGARRRTGRDYAATAAVFVHRATLRTRSAQEVIAQTFGLTPSELRVLLTVIEAGSVAETAETLGLAEATIKTHLHRIFAKTGTTRQLDLVRLAAGFASPLSR